MNPDTIITAELLAGLDKCPFCEDDVENRSSRWVVFKCWTTLHAEQKPEISRSTHCERKELSTLRDRVSELDETNKTLHSLMASGERRGVEKATEEWSQRVSELEAKVKRLTEAGDRLSNPFAAAATDIKAWTKAKESL